MRGQLAHVEDDDVAAAVLFGGPGGHQGPLEPGPTDRGGSQSMHRSSLHDHFLRNTMREFPTQTSL